MTLKIQSPNNTTPTAVEDVYMTVADMTAISDSLNQYYNGTGRLWAWGDNTLGQFGNSSVLSRSSPVQVGSLTSWEDVGGSALFALKETGTIWETQLSSPVQIGTAIDWQVIFYGGDRKAALNKSNELFMWGTNSVGELGLGDITTRALPTQVGLGTNWKTIAISDWPFGRFSLATKTDGTLWSWGSNREGTLGLGLPVSDTELRSSPVQVGSMTDWSSVSAGLRHVHAIKTDGSLWSWGFNTNGQLGTGDRVQRSSPVQVGLLNNWLAVYCGDSHSCAIKTDGSLWSWGFNTNGQLGTGDIVDRSSPVRVGGLSDWAIISCGNAHTLAIKTNGSLWSWGSNSSGALGISVLTTQLRSSPVQVGSMTNWYKCHAVMNGGTSFAISKG